MLNRKCDAHTHPFERFESPDGMRKFADAALAQGLDEIIFTEHAPVNPELHSPHGMIVDDLKSYWEWATLLKAEYASRLLIRVGLEIDYHPGNLDYSREIIAMYPFEYLAGSVHLHSSFWRRQTNGMTADEHVSFGLEQTCRMIATGLFETVAHLDFFRWKISKFEPSKHESEFRNVFEMLLKHDVALELNTSGRRKDFASFLPCADVWTWSLDYPLRRVLGSDAHLPENVGQYFSEA